MTASAHPSKKSLRTALAIGVAVVAGAAIGVLIVPRAPTPSDRKEAAPSVSLLGAALPLDSKAHERALERVRNFVRAPFTLKLPDQRVKSYSLGRLGASIDRVRLAQLVRDAGDATSPLRRVWRGNPERGALTLPNPVELELDRTVFELLKLKDALDRLPVDARLNLERRELVREVRGRQLDVDATFANMQDAIRAGERSAEVVFAFKEPRRRASELDNVRFERVLGHFETPYSRSQKAEARTFNLRLAASKLDGYVLMPGEIFDFNEVVGPRDEANGYKVAHVIAEGELVDGIGGGTCQISGTLHGAAFFAGLEIVERYPHTRPSSYIKMGLDATVVYPTINFRLKNSYEFPVVLHQTVKNGNVRAEILGPRKTRTVTLIRSIDAVVPYQELERPDKDVPDGMRLLQQRGIPGFRLHRYRIIREGAHAVRERWNDVYPPTAQIIRVGTGSVSAEAFKGSSDSTPEYVADEVLILTNDVDETELVEKREPGRFGRYGWTEKEGMPVWSGREQSPEQ